MDIKNALVSMFKQDQYSINTAKYFAVTKRNKKILQLIIEQVGWPNAEKYGRPAESAAWLIAQHSDFDINFQEKCLSLIQNFPQTEERKEDIIYLTDRILVNKGKKQIYGTQSIIK